MSRAPPDWAVAPHTDIMDGFEVRLNPDGTIDEIVTDRPCTFHMEQMDDGMYWIGLKPTKGNPKREYQCIMLTRKGKFIYPTVYR